MHELTAASPDHDSRHCDPIHVNALQYTCPIHMLKKHSNTYKFSPRYMFKTYKDVVQYIYPHMYWIYVLDICLGLFFTRLYMYWITLYVLECTRPKTYHMSSNTYNTGAQETHHTNHKQHITNTNTQGKKHNTPCLAFSFLFCSPGPAPNFENNGRIRVSDWLKFLIPRGTIEKFLLFFKNAVNHAWAAPAS